MTIDEICSACLNALRAEGYNESTVSWKSKFQFQ